MIQDGTGIKGGGEGRDRWEVRKRRQSQEEVSDVDEIRPEIDFKKRRASEEILHQMRTSELPIFPNARLISTMIFSCEYATL